MNRSSVRRRTAAAVASLTVLAGALSACNSAASGGDSGADAKSADEICPTEETEGTIKIGMSSPNLVYAPFLLAMESGAFEDAGIDIEIEAVTAAESLPLVARGQLDAQMTALSSSHFNTLNDGVGVKWILAMDNQQELPPGTPVPGFWSREDVVGSAEDPDLSKLDGAAVSTPTGGSGISGLILDNALSEVGLGLDDVELSTLVGADALSALENGAVDAAWISGPMDVQASDVDGLVPVAGYEPGVTGTAFTAGRSLLDRPELAVKFTEVLSAMTEEYLQGDYRENPEVVDMLAQAMEVEPSTVERSALLKFDPTFSMDGTEEFAGELQDFAMERGELEYDEPLDPADLIDTRISDALATCDSVVG